MTITEQTGSEILDRLGVDRWDTFPPAAGEIRFFAGDRQVAHGRYRVLLSYGPSDKYTMGWAIDAYRANGVPTVSEADAGGTAVVEPATRQQAAERGRQLLPALGADSFLYWCSTLLVVVDQLTVEKGAVGGAGDDERFGRLGAAVARRQQPRDDQLSGPEKRALLGELRQLGLSSEAETSMVFVIEADAGEVEMSRPYVPADELETLVRAYWMLPTWSQRVCMVHLLSDHDAQQLEPVWKDILRAPDGEAGDVRHAAKAVALARLDGDMDRFDDYFADLELTARAGRRRA